jgi:CcmD family protein
MKKIIISLLLIIFATLPSFAQEAPEMADIMRSNGKIYVVVAVLGIVLAGVLFYLISLDSKISKLEKEIK